MASETSSPGAFVGAPIGHLVAKARDNGWAVNHSRDADEVTFTSPTGEMVIVARIDADGVVVDGETQYPGLEAEFGPLFRDARLRLEDALVSRKAQPWWRRWFT